ncbi:hypothetical protein [Flavihumibacter solisilvae]|uniref:Uncharacterized protein n=1 Tax=Flavihumibacter solisilvae TaxID=1349421 RepID=A0A0C1L807_9BACT|nr:hypothetical protein [Flavihumibacter solisilvae]KIC95751.1 hypothetical protein OI18_03620 [Flavihumibacter solisilvae]
MNTKLVMSASAVFLGVIGISLSFLADEIAAYLQIGSAPIDHLVLQVLGAFYFAFALLDWMAKGSFIGGIYNRPIAIANLAHFLIGGLAMIKALMNHPALPWVIAIIAGLYLAFALVFGVLFFRTPVPSKAA